MTTHYLKPEKAIAAAIDAAEEVESLAELANFSPVQYGQRREALAEQLNINLAFLDQEYRERRKHAKGQRSNKTNRSSGIQTPGSNQSMVQIYSTRCARWQNRISCCLMAPLKRSLFGFFSRTRMTASTFRQYLASRAPRRNAARQLF